MASSKDILNGIDLCYKTIQFEEGGVSRKSSKALIAGDSNDPYKKQDSTAALLCLIIQPRLNVKGSSNYPEKNCGSVPPAVGCGDPTAQQIFTPTFVPPPSRERIFSPGKTFPQSSVATFFLILVLSGLRTRQHLNLLPGGRSPPCFSTTGP
jgi:hypothetical protein